MTREGKSGRDSTGTHLQHITTLALIYIHQRHWTHHTPKSFPLFPRSLGDHICIPLFRYFCLTCLLFVFSNISCIFHLLVYLDLLISFLISHFLIFPFSFLFSNTRSRSTRSTHHTLYFPFMLYFQF